MAECAQDVLAGHPFGNPEPFADFPLGEAIQTVPQQRFAHMGGQLVQRQAQIAQGTGAAGGGFRGGRVAFQLVDDDLRVWRSKGGGLGMLAATVVDHQVAGDAKQKGARVIQRVACFQREGEHLRVHGGEPLAGLDVDLWHCNATGHYSGYDVDPDSLPENISNGQKPTNDKTFLRGRLTTDTAGQVPFRTIYPAWYALRTPHIHLKIFEGENCNTTTQLYLPEALNQELCETADYARTAEQDTFNRTDPVIGNSPGDSSSLWIEIDQADAFSQIRQGSA